MQTRPRVSRLWSIVYGLIIVLAMACAGKQAPKYAQKVTPEIQAAFNEAEAVYIQKDFNRADRLFAAFIEHYPANALTDESRFRRGEIRFGRGQYDLALPFYRESFAHVSSAKLTPRAELKISLCLFLLERPAEAIAELNRMERQHMSALLKVRADSVGLLASEQIEGEARRAIRSALFLLDDYAALGQERAELASVSHIVAEEEAFARVRTWLDNPDVTLAEIEALPLADYRGKRSGGYAVFKLAQKRLAAGQEAAALADLDSYLRTYPEHELAPRARLLHGEIGGRLGEGATKIGVILPLSGEYRVYGESVLHGVECAAGIYDPCRGPAGVLLLIRDSRGDESIAAAAVDELAQEGVQALIGPLTSHEVPQAAARAQALGIPMITLTQRSHVAEIGNAIFRNSITPGSQVNSVVDYIIGRRRMKRFFVLYPDNDLGKEFESLFSSAVTSAGGSVVGRKKYVAHQMNFAEQFQDLEEGYDALFIPDAPRALGYIAPTLAALGIKGVTLLGTIRWDNPQLIQRGGEYVNGAIFVGAFVKTAQNLPAQQFAEWFHTAYGFDPTLLEALGYDSMRMLIASVQEGVSVRRASIRDALARLADFPGVTGRISFDAEGDAVRKLTLLTVIDGEVRPIDP